MKRSVKVEIFGHEYILKADNEDSHIQRVADFVDGKMKEVSVSTNSKSVTNIAILAALNIADEYLQIKEEREQVEAKARDLSRLLDISL